MRLPNTFYTTFFFIMVLGSFSCSYLPEPITETPNLIIEENGDYITLTSSLVVWSVDYMPEFTWRTHKRFNYSVGLGIRYTSSPAYDNYGAINQVLDFPIKLGMRFNLRKPE